MENSIESTRHRISVIVPVYNVENYLTYCVDSLLRQTYADFEILLIDDGSTDSSGRLCDVLQEKDRRIAVFHKQNGGLSDARNFGIEHAAGDFYCFIDSDDVLHPDFLTVLIEKQKKYNADIVSTKMMLFSDHKMLSDFDTRTYAQSEEVFYDTEILAEYFDPQAQRHIHHGLCMKLYKKELFKDLRFTVGRLHEDLYITHCLLNISHCFVLVNLPYYYYFQKNSNSICKNYKSKNFIDECDAVSLMITAYEHNPEVYVHLKLFVAEQYLYLITRFYGYLNKDKNLKSKNNELKRWVRDYVKSEQNLSFKYKIKTYIKLSFPHIYTWHLLRLSEKNFGQGVEI